MTMRAADEVLALMDDPCARFGDGEPPLRVLVERRPEAWTGGSFDADLERPVDDWIE